MTTRFLVILMLGAASLLAQESAGAQKPEDNTNLWKWANFAILAAGLGYFIGKHAPGMFKARTAEIQKGIAEAQQVKRDAEKRAAEVDAKMTRLGADIEAFRAQAKTEMEREGARIRQETTAQIEKIHQQSALEIEFAGKTARRELREYAAQLALDLAKQRIQQRMTPALDAALVAGFVADLERQGSQN
ncbi:MAG TPA: ATP synthase F0 subunit B [Bryobacteraceae bacterium]|nr:ATP synthase F0 subunit B [Bryobacteraceae bacterium]